MTTKPKATPKPKQQKAKELAPNTKRVKKNGAPPKVKRTEDWKPRFLEFLAKGLSVSDIYKMEDMPCIRTIYTAIRDDPEFEAAYLLAREIQAEQFRDELIEIADDGRNDYVAQYNQEGEVVGYTLNGEHVQRSRLRIDTRKWLMSRMAPKRYSERTVQELVGKDGGPIQTQSTMTLNQFYDELGTEPSKS